MRRVGFPPLAEFRPALGAELRARLGLGTALRTLRHPQRRPTIRAELPGPRRPPALRAGGLLRLDLAGEYGRLLRLLVDVGDHLLRPRGGDLHVRQRRVGGAEPRRLVPVVVADPPRAFGAADETPLDLLLRLEELVLVLALPLRAH